MTGNLLIRHADILSSAGAEKALQGDILIRDGIIEEVAPALDVPNVEVLDATGCLAIPGLINAHLHSPGNLMRGTLDGLPLELFMLFEVPPLAQGTEDPDVVRVRTLLGAMEMLKLGITSVLDDAFFVPLVSREAIDALCGAYADIGMRATVALDQPIVVEYEKYPFLADLLPDTVKRTMDAAPRETAEGMLAHYRDFIARWHGGGDGLIGAAVSCSAPQRATAEYLCALSELSRDHHIPYFCHILETKLQRVLGDEKYGRSLVQVVDDLGILNEYMEVIHAIWVDDDDIARLARSGATVAHNPVCNLRLGSGVMPYAALRRAGVPIALGTDEAISDDSHNLWGTMKTAATVHSLATPDFEDWPTASDILSAVWDGGSRAMHRPVSVGRLVPGASGDVALLDKDAPSFLPLHDVRRQLVLCEAGRAVRHTVVNGRVVVRNGHLTTIDEAALVGEVRAMEPRLREMARAVREGAAPLFPYYREMVRRAAQVPVGFSRWVGSR
ncbi:MAG: amidohydrolase family protein [Pseudomonadota bacterium]